MYKDEEGHLVGRVPRTREIPVVVNSHSVPIKQLYSDYQEFFKRVYNSVLEEFKKRNESLKELEELEKLQKALQRKEEQMKAKMKAELSRERQKRPSIDEYFRFNNIN